MQQPTSINEEVITFGNTEIFLLTLNNFQESSERDDILFMVKSRPYIDSYREIANKLQTTLGGGVRNILEVGVFKGGSTAFFNEFFQPDRLVCIDSSPTLPLPLARYMEGRDHKIRPYFGTSQGDRSRVTEILNAEFSHPIDLVVDDASHAYELTKATFETVFPYLRPGAAYVIEDWNWALSPSAQAGATDLTNLVLELVIAYGAGGLIDHVAFGPGLMWVFRGGKPIEKANFRLADHTPARRNGPLPSTPIEPSSGMRRLSKNTSVVLWLTITLIGLILRSWRRASR